MLPLSVVACRLLPESVTALFRIVGLWRPQAAWLLAGGLVSLAALASLLGLLANSAAFAIGGAVAGGLTLRLLGTSRVVLRYFERLITHSALFRALAGLRVWFFRGLALRAAGGLGFRDAGDLLARLVNDVEALDAVYLRLLLPFAACVVLLPVLLVLFATVSPGLASIVGLLFALSAFVLPLVAARLSLSIGQQLTAAGAALRVACCMPSMASHRWVPRTALWNCTGRMCTARRLLKLISAAAWLCPETPSGLCCPRCKGANWFAAPGRRTRNRRPSSHSAGLIAVRFWNRCLIRWRTASLVRRAAVPLPIQEIGRRAGRTR